MQELKKSAADTSCDPIPSNVVVFHSVILNNIFMWNKFKD